MSNKFNRQRKRLLIEAQLGVDPEKQRYMNEKMKLVREEYRHLATKSTS